MEKWNILDVTRYGKTFLFGTYGHKLGLRVSCMHLKCLGLCWIIFTGIMLDDSCKLTKIRA